jgi:hypothetical protein
VFAEEKKTDTRRGSPSPLPSQKTHIVPIYCVSFVKIVGDRFLKRKGEIISELEYRAAASHVLFEGCRIEANENLAEDCLEVFPHTSFV